MKRIILIALLMAVSTTIILANDTTPEFSAWVECIQRGPYEGQAVAHVAYSFAGEFEVIPEDSRLLGDTTTGDTIVLNYPIQPGEHRAAILVNVGAQKAILWKIILFKNLYVVTIWDDPQVQDCPWVLPDVTPEVRPSA